MIQRIKDLRNDHDLSQTEVAQAIGVTQRKYSYIETGTQRADEDILSALADYYHTSVDYLLGRTDEIRPYPKKK